MSSFKLNKIKHGFTSTTTSGGTLTLTSSSRQYQILTGSSNHTVKLPDATTLGNGINFVVQNQSSGSITVQDNGLNTIATVSAGFSAELNLTANGTANGTWRVQSFGGQSVSGMGSVAPGTAKTANYTIQASDNGGTINVNVGSGSLTMTLPSPIANFKVTIKDSTGSASITNNIYIARSSASVKIDNEPNDDIIITAYYAVTYISDGTNWFRVGSSVFP